MPSQSKSQFRLMKWAEACKSGKAKNCPKNIKKIAKSLKKKQLKEFTNTDYSSLKENKVLSFTEFIENN